MVLDPAFGARMDAIFRDDLRHAREITLPAFERRPWTARVTEWAANLLTRVL
jgi:hypothetical protein